MAASHAAGFGQLAALYRQVLRVHRYKLPGPLRMLGDGYAAEEFRRHLNGKTTAAQWQEFGTQWQAYVAALREDTQQRHLVADVVQLDLTADQRQQLEQLKRAAFDLARGDGTPPPEQPSDPRVLG